MPNLSLTVPHHLSQDEALTRVKGFIDQARQQFSGYLSDFQESWNGYVGNFSASGSGYSVSGEIGVNPSAVNVESSLPMVAIVFKAQIESYVRETLAKLLA
jgi:Putative polyhydroxyalkanoic acid system protein (PHA_gran_rgn)